MATAVTLLVGSGRWDLARFEMSPTAFTREPWRLVLSALPHALDFGTFDVFHLPFNLYWLWLFGTLIEEVFGPVKALGLILVLAAGSGAAEYALFRGGIGLSGVTYGMFGMLWFLAPRDRRFADAVDARTTQLMVGWFFLCIFATASKAWAVANVAHGVGALLGVLAGAAVAARQPARRVLAAVALPALLALSFAGGGVLRPRVNLAHDGHGSFRLGYQAIQDGRLDDAIRHFQASIAVDPRDAITWYDLGIAYESAHRAGEAVDAFHHAYQIDPHDSRHRDGYIGACRTYAVAAQKRGDHAAAIPLLRAAVEVDPDDTFAWFGLHQSYTALGQMAEADDARDHLVHLPQRAAPAP
jgi:membrane associated rhomboid family serine protease